MPEIKPIITAHNSVINRWLHKHQDWPNFTWDAQQLSAKLAELRHRQGRLLRKMESLGFKFK